MPWLVLRYTGSFVRSIRSSLWSFTTNWCQVVGSGQEILWRCFDKLSDQVSLFMELGWSFFMFNGEKPAFWSASFVCPVRSSEGCLIRANEVIWPLKPSSMVNNGHSNRSCHRAINTWHTYSRYHIIIWYWQEDPAGSHLLHQQSILRKAPRALGFPIFD